MHAEVAQLTGNILMTASNMSMMGHNMSMGNHNMTVLGHNMSTTGHNAHANHNLTSTHPMDHMNTHHDGHKNLMNSNSAHAGHSGGGHALYFSFILPIQVLFFEWNIEDDVQLAISCVGIFLLAVLYEGLKVWRQYLLIKAKSSASSSFDSGLSVTVGFSRKKTSKLSRMCNGWHLFQSILHAIQTTLGMFLMLIYMTFNIWLAIVVSLGSGVGYFFFAWLIPSKPGFGDHCQ